MNKAALDSICMHVKAVVLYVAHGFGHVARRDSVAPTAPH
jgi:hypothetical protein